MIAATIKQSVFEAIEAYFEAHNSKFILHDVLRRDLADIAGLTEQQLQSFLSRNRSTPSDFNDYIFYNHNNNMEYQLRVTFGGRDIPVRFEIQRRHIPV